MKPDFRNTTRFERYSGKCALEIDGKIGNFQMRYAMVQWHGTHEK
jgi:hypothetical protein